MTSELMKSISDKIRGNRSTAPLNANSIPKMRRNMESQQSKLRLPEGVVREDLFLGECAACSIGAPGARDDRGILYLHGGGYIMGSLDTHQELMARIALNTGVPVYGLDYRLAPENPWPRAIDDAVIGWEGLLSLGISPKNLVVAGDSAGGGLAMSLMLALKARDSAMPAAAVLMSPVTDLTCSGASMSTRSEADPMLIPQNLKFMIEQYHGENDPGNPAISPLFGDLKGLPPLLIQVGDAEILLDDSLRLHHFAQEAGVSSTLQVYEEAFHVFQSVPILPEADEAVAEIAAFCNRQWK